MFTVAAPYTPGVVVFETAAAAAAAAKEVPWHDVAAGAAGAASAVPPTELERYVGILIVADRAHASGQWCPPPRTSNQGGGHYRLGKQTVQATSLGAEVFLAAQALASVYVHQGVSALATSAAAATATLALARASAVLEMAADVYARHEATMPDELRERPSLRAEAQRLRAHLVAEVARQAAFLQEANTQADGETMAPLLPYMAGFIDRYQQLAAQLKACQLDDLARMALAQSALWTARFAYALATTTTTTTTTNSLWACVMTAAHDAMAAHAAVAPAANLLLDRADVALRELAEARLRQPPTTGADAQASNVLPTALANTARLAVDLGPAQRAALDDLTALGQVWWAQHMMVRPAEAEAISALSLPSPPPTQRATLGRALHLPESHPLLQHALIDLLEAVALRATIVERERRLRHGNDTRDHHHVHTLLTLSRARLDALI